MGNVMARRQSPQSVIRKGHNQNVDSILVKTRSANNGFNLTVAYAQASYPVGYAP